VAADSEKAKELYLDYSEILPSAAAPVHFERRERDLPYDDFETDRKSREISDLNHKLE
jgi:hypothetical protein